MSTILLAGGAGYIGSHTAVELLNAGYEVVVADNYSNSCPEAIKRVEKITGKSVKLYELDIKDNAKLETVFQENQIDAVIHFAGLKGKKAVIFAAVVWTATIAAAAYSYPRIEEFANIWNEYLLP